MVTGAVLSVGQVNQGKVDIPTPDLTSGTSIESDTYPFDDFTLNSRQLDPNFAFSAHPKYLSPALLGQFGGNSLVQNTWDNGPSLSQLKPDENEHATASLESPINKSPHEALPENRTRKSKPKRGRTVVTTTVKKNEPRTRRKKPSAKASAQSQAVRKGDRRENMLERNRVAASKCRSRKKIWTENLEEKKSRLQKLHGELMADYWRLLQESSLLKSMIISHAGCHEPNIDMWIKFETSRHIGKSSATSQAATGSQSLNERGGE